MPHFASARKLSEAIPDFKVEDSSTQRDLSARIDLLQKERLFNSFGGVRDKARLNAVSAPRASAIFSSFPSSKIGNGLMPDEWYVIVARHLGLRIFEEEFPCPAPGCKKMMDVFADHAMVCFCKGDRTRRHNAERNVIHSDMRIAGLSPVLEPPHILRNGGKKKPADIFVSDWSEGKGACSMSLLRVHSRSSTSITQQKHSFTPLRIMQKTSRSPNIPKRVRPTTCCVSHLFLSRLVE
jgi:hypothetical protein